jgi:hypothetical protein
LEKRRDLLNDLFGAWADMYGEVEQRQTDSASDPSEGDD